MSTVLKIAAVVHALIAIAHGLNGLQLFGRGKEHYQRLPRSAAVPYRTGWYQGCSLFTILALLNYRWSITGLDGTDKTIAVVATATYIVSSYTYRTVGDPAQWPTLVAGVLQAYAAFVR